MTKYIVWLSDSHGEYVKADQVRNDAERLIFERLIDKTIKKVAEYNIKNILGYNEVEEN